MNKKEILEIMKNVWDIEIKSINNLKDRIDIETIISVIKAVSECKKQNGRVVTIGAGSSSIQARKITHNFSCIEVPSFFLSTEVASHGGLGALQKNDVVFALSRGGKTREILDIIPAIKKKGAKLVAVTENEKSELAKASDILLKIKIDREADPFNMFATSSTMAILAVFDAIIVLIMTQEGYKEEQFGIIHPGGAVGERLLDKI
jgi:KpsF/GutQ family protein